MLPTLITFTLLSAYFTLERAFPMTTAFTKAVLARLAVTGPLECTLPLDTFHVRRVPQ